MRKYRLKEIQKILSLQNINSQEVLLAKLNEGGISITQATLSRDLAYLKVGKFFIPEKGYIYVMPQDIKQLEQKAMQSDANLHGVISVKFSKNIAVIHTLAGFANQICVLIDSAKIPESMGTIAGDDTILLVMDENVSHEQFKIALLEKFPALEDRI